jgi:transcriptional regulator with XRE-family HTH domain
MTLRDFLGARGIRMDAAAIMAGVDKATICRIANGKSKPRPETILRLAKAFGMSARRMESLCDASRETARTA